MELVPMCKLILASNGKKHRSQTLGGSRAEDGTGFSRSINPGAEEGDYSSNEMPDGHHLDVKPKDQKVANLKRPFLTHLGNFYPFGFENL